MHAHIEDIHTKNGEKRRKREDKHVHTKTVILQTEET